MNRREIIRNTEKFVQKTVKGDPGHDWSHIDRVRRTALYLGRKEKADLFVVELGALLHDVADYKFYKGDHKVGGKIASAWLKKNRLPSELIDHVQHIVDEVSFKGAGVKYGVKTLEGKIVQDADKLDAIGAIGVARTFSFGGKFDVPIYIPGKKPLYHTSFAQYKKLSASTINHFYEKLLLLKDRMHTKTVKRLAADRHKYMQNYLKQFYKEWNQI